MVPLYALLMALAHFVIHKATKPTFEKIVKCQDDAELKKRYVEKCTNSACKFFINGAFLIWGSKILAGTKWLPWQLGGTVGSFEGMFENIPFTPEPAGTRDFALVCLGLYTF